MLEWASQSPDLNLIEHIWAYIKLKLKEFQAKNMSELKTEILRILNSIPLEFVQKLVNSMPKKSMKVYKAKGEHTLY